MKLKFPKNFQSSYYFIYKVLINLHSEFSSLASASQLQLDNKREHAPRLMNDSISNFYLHILVNEAWDESHTPESGVLREGESDPQLGSLGDKLRRHTRTKVDKKCTWMWNKMTHMSARMIIVLKFKMNIMRMTTLFHSGLCPLLLWGRILHESVLLLRPSKSWGWGGWPIRFL